MIKKTLAGLVLAGALSGCYNEISYDYERDAYVDKIEKVAPENEKKDDLNWKKYLPFEYETESSYSVDEQIKLVEWYDDAKIKQGYKDSLANFFYKNLKKSTEGYFETAYSVNVPLSVSEVNDELMTRLKFNKKKYFLSPADILQEKDIDKEEIEKIKKFTGSFYDSWPDDKAYVPVKTVFDLMNIDLKKAREIKNRKDNKLGEYAELTLQEYLTQNNMDEDDLINLYEKRDDKSIKKLTEILEKTLYKHTKGEYKVSIQKVTKEPLIENNEKIMIGDKFIKSNDEITYHDVMMPFQKAFNKLGVDIDSQGTHDRYYEALNRLEVSLNFVLIPGDNDFELRTGGGVSFSYANKTHDSKAEIGVFFSDNSPVKYEGLDAKYFDLIDHSKIEDENIESYEILKFKSKVERNTWGAYLSISKYVTNYLGIKGGVFYVPEGKKISLEYSGIYQDPLFGAYPPRFSETQTIKKEEGDGGVILGTNLRYKRVSLEPAAFFSMFNKPIYQIGINFTTGE